MKNQSSVTAFIMQGLSIHPQLQILLVLIFLIIYVMALLGNLAIIAAILSSPRLHKPMYFFLFHLAVVDIICTTTIMPKMLENLVTIASTISFSGCIAQLYSFTWCLGAEMVLFTVMLFPGCITQMSFILLMGCTKAFMLSAMAYDRYVAVCVPLHYVRIMDKRLCGQLVGGAWLISAFFSLVNTAPVLFLHFCRTNKINGLSCELPSLLALSCTETMVSQMVFLISFPLLAFLSFSITLVSYIYIILTILKIRSTAGRHKAFSTCSSHITVVVLYYGAVLFCYLGSGSVPLVALDRLFSIQYSVLTPMLNTIIYSLNNREVKRALRKILGKMQGKHIS